MKQLEVMENLLAFCTKVLKESIEKSLGESIPIPIH